MERWGVGEEGGLIKAKGALVSREDGFETLYF